MLELWKRSFHVCQRLTHFFAIDTDEPVPSPPGGAALPGPQGVRLERVPRAQAVHLVAAPRGRPPRRQDASRCWAVLPGSALFGLGRPARRGEHRRALARHAGKVAVLLVLTSVVCAGLFWMLDWLEDVI